MGTGTATTYTYTYDDRGNITQIVDGNDKVTRYKYDSLGQLTREDNPYTNTTYVYAYDKNGNRLSKTTYAYTTATSLGTATSTQTYTYDTESGWGDRLTAFNGTAITYDAIGNPLSYNNGNQYSFTWKDGRRLATATKGGVNYSFTYNDEGIRTSKTVGSVKHTYILDGTRIVSEKWGNYFIVYLYDESGSPIGMQYRTLSYAEGAFDTFYFEKNLQGDIIAVYNASGTKLVGYTYDAWGNCTTTYYNGGGSTGAQYNPFRYRGYYYDTDLGLYYLNSRYYDPNTGRFINADGYVNANGDLIGFNAYAYCSNNPIMNVDHSGEGIGTIIALSLLMSIMFIPVACVIGEPIIELLGEIDDIDASNELYNSNRNSTTDDTFTEKGMWYDIQGGSNENMDVGFINASAGFDKGIYSWEYFETEFGVGRISVAASTSLDKGFGFSANAETVYGTAKIKIPISNHKLSIGATGNLGGWGASFFLGKDTEIGLSCGIGGRIVISWD